MYKYSIKDMRDLAAKRDGDCLSKKYLGQRTKLRWKCSDGHIWNAVPDNLLYGNRWCPKCAKRKHFTEEKCRYIIEQMTGLPFPNNRKVLSGLEIDLYNDSSKVGIEYNGIQHYEFVKGWHKTQDGFKECQNRDARTIRKCEELGINLAVVSYKNAKTDGCLVLRIREIVRKWNLPIVVEKINFKNFYRGLSVLRDLKKKAASFGGCCLSTEYIDCETKCHFQCGKGHVFKMEPRHVKSGHWCNECGNIRIGNKNRRLGLVDAQLAASKHSGKCLSASYKGTQHKLRWQCSEGHIWEAPFNQIRSGRWCNSCGNKRSGIKRRSTLKSVQDAAIKRGGSCLSTKYVNDRTKLEFECIQGHRWWATPGNIKSGKWCRKCSYKIRVRKMNDAKLSIAAKNSLTFLLKSNILLAERAVFK